MPFPSSADVPAVSVEPAKLLNPAGAVAQAVPGDGGRLVAAQTGQAA